MGSTDSVTVSLGLFLIMLLVFFAVWLVQFVCWGKIGEKCGSSFWLTAIFMQIPVVNLFMFLFLGFAKRPKKDP